MRFVFVAALIVASSPALAQSLDGAVGSGLGGGLPSGLGGGLASGIPSGLGSQQQGRTKAQIGGIDLDLAGGCAPRQASINRGECRPVRELNAGSISTYDRSIAATGPLSGQTLTGLTLDSGSGPEGPLD